VIESQINHLLKKHIHIQSQSQHIYTGKDGQQRLLIAAGGVDKFLTLYTLSPAAVPEKSATLGGFPGPLLSLDLAPGGVEVMVCMWVQRGGCL
jgi:hypothetical protein